MNKAKNTPILRKDCIMVSPLSVAMCVAEIQNMAHYELEIEVARQSDHSAELQVVERHNDDVPLYITYRLMATEDGTCIAYHLNSLILRQSKRPRKERDPFSQAVATIIGLIFIAIIMLDLGGEVFALALVISLPMMLFMIGAKEISVNTAQPEKTAYQSEKVRRIMLERGEAVRDDVIATLNRATTDIRYDELGNAYYLDASNNDKRATS